jgi:Raf kinase inhibitor-like YbhB/YbcL family protein
MKITSPAFKDGDMIPKKYTCEGEDVCPPLEISDVPRGAQSLTLMVHDHDAPSGDFVHWLLWNIDPKTVEKIDEGTTPIGAVDGMTDFGRAGWGGPCPPSGKHKYEFHLYALDSTLDLPAESDKTAFRAAIEGKVIEEASLAGFYEKA